MKVIKVEIEFVNSSGTLNDSTIVESILKTLSSYSCAKLIKFNSCVVEVKVDNEGPTHLK